MKISHNLDDCSVCESINEKKNVAGGLYFIRVNSLNFGTRIDTTSFKCW